MQEDESLSAAHRWHQAQCLQRLRYAALCLQLEQNLGLVPPAAEVEAVVTLDGDDDDDDASTQDLLRE